MSKSALCRFRRKDLEKAEVEETAGKCNSTCLLSFHYTNYLLPSGTSLASFLPCIILKSNLLYTNTEVNISTELLYKWLAALNFTRKQTKHQQAFKRHCIDWTCHSTSSSTVLVPEGAVPAQAQHNHTCVAHSAHRDNTASVCIHFCILTWCLEKADLEQRLYRVKE